MPKFKKGDLLDPTTLDKEFNKQLKRSGKDPLQGECRVRFLDLFRRHLQEGRENLHQCHLQGASGRFQVKGLCYLVDQLLARLHLLAWNPEGAKKPGLTFTLVATGGYGRGELAPYSDIDLLFLMPDGLHPELGLQVEKVLYFLWDLGLDVGHAVRNVAECVEHARTDIEIRTSMLESRFLSGSQRFFKEYQKVLFQQVLQDPESFLRAKLVEQRKRHERFGDSLFYLEPNIKENPGGLRDIHTFFWISKYRYQVDKVKELIPKGLITKEEYQAFIRCREFLWRVRCGLHYRAGRREDRLTFNHQVELARELNYRDRPGLQGVEQFMRRYYQVANQVGHLSQIFLAKYQEELRQKRGEADRPLEDVFWLVGDKLAVLEPEAFQEDPVRLMRLFQVAQQRTRPIHPETMRLVNRNLRLVNRAYRHDKAVARIFLEIMSGHDAVAWVLKRMNACGLLGRYLPEFGRITGQTQHDLYHVYTVDEHSIRAVDSLTRIKRGELQEELPLSTGVMGQLRNPSVLYVAVLLHDVAKGRGGQHEVKGATISHHICQRLGMSTADTEMVVWLVRHHLIFSRTAFRRDINDPDTVAQFARQVGDKRRLDLLLLLTVADIRAVGPGIWNQWKATLLRRLYLLALEAITRGVFRPEEVARLAMEQRSAVEEILCQRCDPQRVVSYLGRFYPDYFLSHDPETLAGHYLALAPMLADPLAIVCRSSIDSDTTELLLHTQDHPGLIAKVSGALSANGANILAANINTTKDGMALDIFTLQDNQGRAIGNPDMLGRIEQSLQGVLTGQLKPEDLLARRPLGPRKQVPFRVPPQVEVDNQFSDLHTVVEVTAKDRPGLLFFITREIQRRGVQITSAKIATYGERAVDVFYLRDMFGLKLSPRKVESLTSGLLEVLTQLDREDAGG